MDNENLINLDEATTVEEKKVRLNREWSFWENYEPKDKTQQQDYSKLLKLIYSFQDLISFWQFWNKYPGATPSNIFFNGEYIKYFFPEKYRIIAMNLFQAGIRPEWEDERNKKGKILTLEYIIDNDLDKFLGIVKDSWTKLLCSLMGENIINSQFINGVRFIDKTKIGGGKKIIFRFEVWVNKSIDETQLNLITEYFKKNYGCEGISIKDIQ